MFAFVVFVVVPLSVVLAHVVLPKQRAARNLMTGFAFDPFDPRRMR